MTQAVADLVRGKPVTPAVAKSVTPYALMARDSYAASRNGASVYGYARSSDWEKFLKSSGATDEELKAWRASGFSATLFVKGGNNPAQAEAVVAYRGSSELGLSLDAYRDWLKTNIPAAGQSAQLPAQYAYAVAFANKVRTKYPNVTLTGHSLGGSLASYAGNIIGGNVYTFNSPRNIFSDMPTFNAKFHETNIITTGDFVSDPLVDPLLSTFSASGLRGDTFYVTPNKSQTDPHSIDDLSINLLRTR